MSTSRDPRLIPTARRRSVSRAELSPVGIAPAVLSARAQVAPASLLPKIRLEPAPWPAWHRGPLDRLQPVLTRYRD